MLKFEKIQHKFFKKIFWSFLGFGMAVVFFTIILHQRGVVTSPIGWDKDFYISPYRMIAKNVELTSKGNLIVAVYEGKEGKVSGVYASISFNGGKKFLSPVRIAVVSSEIQLKPHAAISGDGHIAVVWQNLVGEDKSSRIFYTISTDMGASWSKSNRLFLPSEIELIPRIFYDDKNLIHIFYNAFTKGSFNLYHMVSNNEELFTPPQRLVHLSKDLRGAFFPAICFSGENIFIVWQGKGEDKGVLSDSLFFIRSTNYGNSWSFMKKITSSLANDASPSIILFKDILYLVYQNNDHKNWSIMLKKGYENGSKWEKDPIEISTTKNDCFSPHIVSTDNDEVIIIWHDARERKQNIFGRKFSILENRLLSEVMLSTGRSPAKKPVAISLGNKVIVLWEENGRIVSKFSDTYVEPPTLFSRTHPENIWSRSLQAVIEWEPPKDESGIVAYAVITNRLLDFNPTIENVGPSIKSMKIPNLDDGIVYFHIRAIDGAGNFSRTIHYKIQVSGNPPPIPFVFSSTHPEGQEGGLNLAQFEWSIDERERVKGFLYNITKNTFKDPDIFTVNFKKTFYDLQDGRYFFNIRSVDKTNAHSKIASYEFIVGRAEEIDSSFYEKIAKGVGEKKMLPKKVVARKKPEIIVDFPFNIAKPFNRTEYEAYVKTKNIRSDYILGYSFSVGMERIYPVNRINSRKNIINIKNLKSGAYFLGVKCRFFRIKEGKRVFYWTKPVYKKFSVLIPSRVSPLAVYINDILNRLASNLLVISISLLCLSLSIITIGYGTKVSFYTKLLRYKVSSIFE